MNMEETNSFGFTRLLKREIKKVCKYMKKKIQ